MTSIKKEEVKKLEKQTVAIKNEDKIARMKNYIAIDNKKIENYKKRILKLIEWNKTHQERLDKLIAASK